MLFYLLVTLADGYLADIAHTLYVALGRNESAQLDYEEHDASGNGVRGVFGHERHAFDFDTDELA